MGVSSKLEAALGAHAGGAGCEWEVEWEVCVGVVNGAWLVWRGSEPSKSSSFSLLRMG